MASAEIADFLSNCPSPEAGCFASDPNALGSMLYMDDAVIRADFERVANASTKAAIEGTPIEDATYEPATVEVVGISSHVGFDGRTFEVAHSEIGTNPEPRRVLEEGSDDISKTLQRIARCAYVCGATAVGCPLRTAPDA